MNNQLFTTAEAPDRRQVAAVLSPSLKSPAHSEKYVRWFFRARHRFRRVDPDQSEIEPESDIGPECPETREASTRILQRPRRLTNEPSSAGIHERDGRRFNREPDPAQSNHSRIQEVKYRRVQLVAVLELAKGDALALRRITGRRRPATAALGYIHRARLEFPKVETRHRSNTAN